MRINAFTATLALLAGAGSFHDRPPQIVRAGDLDPNIAESPLHARLPPPDAPALVARAPELAHTTNHADHAALRAAVLEARLSRTALHERFEEALRRPPALRWPLLFELAMDDGHALSGPAYARLCAEFGADLEEDWRGWNRLLASRLAALPPADRAAR